MHSELYCNNTALRHIKSEGEVPERSLKETPKNIEKAAGWSSLLIINKNPWCPDLCTRFSIRASNRFPACRARAHANSAFYFSSILKGKQTLRICCAVCILYIISIQQKCIEQYHSRTREKSYHKNE